MSSSSHVTPLLVEELAPFDGEIRLIIVFYLGATPDGAGGSVLTLCSEITAGGAQRIMMSSMEESYLDQPCTVKASFQLSCLSSPKWDSFQVLIIL